MSSKAIRQCLDTMEKKVMNIEEDMGAIGEEMDKALMKKK